MPRGSSAGLGDHKDCPSTNLGVHQLSNILIFSLVRRRRSRGLDICPMPMHLPKATDPRRGQTAHTCVPMVQHFAAQDRHLSGSVKIKIVTHCWRMPCACIRVLAMVNSFDKSTKRREVGLKRGSRSRPSSVAKATVEFFLRNQFCAGARPASLAVFLAGFLKQIEPGGSASRSGGAASQPSSPV